MCYSQTRVDRRWELLPDSFVVAPLEDLCLAAGFRLGQDRRVNNAVREIAALAGENRALEGRIAEKAKIIEAIELQKESLNTELSTCQRDRDKSERSLRVARSWNRILIPAAGVLIGLIILR